jgi:ABC-type sugar transport system permease subunit
VSGKAGVRCMSAVLIGLVVLAPSVGLGRYLGARDARQAELDALAAETARWLESTGSVSTLALGEDLSEGLDGAIVAPGQVDDFGIVRGAAVVARRPIAELAERSDSHELIERYARLRATGQGGVASGVDSLGSLTVLWSAALVSSASEPDRGMVRFARLASPSPNLVPAWWIGIALLLALGASWWAARPWTAALCVGLIGAGLLAPFGASFALIAGALAAGGVGLARDALAGLLEGLREQPMTYLYVAPAMVAMLLLVFVPFAMGVVLAFFDGDGAPVGVANFVEILSPSTQGPTSFYWTFWMTLLWTVSNVILHVSIGLALALVLNRPDLKFRWIYRVLLIVPWAVPNYITALIWKWMFNTQYGAVNALLAIFGVDQIDWFGTSVLTNFVANLVTNTWLGFPFMMVVSLGALQSIPKDLYEAVKIDGANRWQSFRHVTLPLLKPALVPAVILGTIWTFNMFNVIYLVSGGGPDHQTNILITEAYDAFKVMKRYGYAAAYSLLIFVVLYAYGAMTNRITRATEGAFH